MVRLIQSVGDRLLQHIVPQATAAAQGGCPPPHGGSCWGACCRYAYREFCYWTHCCLQCECRYVNDCR